MKLKTTLILASTLVAGVISSNAASYQLINVQGGPGVDTLFANNNGSLMTSGTVAIGYWATGVTNSQIDTITELVPLLASFTSGQTAVPGTSADFSAPGYLAEQLVAGATITGTNTLLGKGVYVIATNASSLASATTSNEFSVFFVRNIQDDVPFEQTYTGNPAGATPIIGSLGTFTGDLGLGAGEYTTLKMAVIPEPSAALLGALGALGLLRRRRA